MFLPIYTCTHSMASVSSFDYITCILTLYLSLLLCVFETIVLYLECKRYKLKQSKAKPYFPSLQFLFLLSSSLSLILSHFLLFPLCSHSIPSLYNTSTPKCMCIEFTIKKQSNYLCVFRKFGSTLKPVQASNAGR